MNLFLHGIGGEEPVAVRDALSNKGSVEFDMVLTNPPFGKKSSITVIGEDGDEQRETLTIVRDDFWATTSNKQLNFVQHVRSILRIDGRAAVVVPDNVLFEGGAGELIRRRLLHDCDVHTLLRLPTGNLTAPDVIAAEIVEDLQAALDEFALIAEDLRKKQ
jgi:type I restriction enzyme M protein